MGFLRFSFFSQVLGNMTEFWAVIPNSIGKGIKDYRILYLLHGFSDDNSIWTRRTSLERYCEGKNMVVVMPDGWRSYYADMIDGLKYGEFIGTELPLVVKDLLPVSKKREDTYIAGLSMGGYGAFRTALNHPDTYVAAGSFSGAVIPYEIRGEAQKNVIKGLDPCFGNERKFKGSRNDLMFLLKGLKASKKQIPKLFQWCGTDDFLYQQNLKFLDFCKKNRIDVDYSEGPGGHTWDCWDNQIKIFLDWLDAPPKRLKVRYEKEF